MLLLLLHLVVVVVMNWHNVVGIDHDGGRARHVLKVTVAEGRAVAQGRVIDACARVQTHARGPAVMPTEESGRTEHSVFEFEVDVIEQLETVHVGKGAGRVSAGDVVELGFDVGVDHLLEGKAEKLRVASEALELSGVVEGKVHRRIEIHFVFKKNLGRSLMLRENKLIFYRVLRLGRHETRKDEKYQLLNKSRSF